MNEDIRWAAYNLAGTIQGAIASLIPFAVVQTVLLALILWRVW